MDHERPDHMGWPELAVHAITLWTRRRSRYQGVARKFILHVWCFSDSGQRFGRSLFLRCVFWQLDSRSGLGIFRKGVLAY